MYVHVRNFAVFARPILLSVVCILMGATDMLSLYSQNKK